MPPSRRSFLGAAAGAASAYASPASPGVPPGPGQSSSLVGEWRFRTDPDPRWTTVTVPHTWQVTAGLTGYRGIAWYEREVDIPAAWAGSVVRIEFEAVFHSAWVTVNGQPAGEHLGKGYTAFCLDITGLLRIGGRNTIEVKVDNSFDERMLPRGRSSDWAHDGGIYRPVRLLVTPRCYIERVGVQADPEQLSLSAVVRNSSQAEFTGSIGYRIVDCETGLVALRADEAQTVRLRGGETAMIDFPETRLIAPKLWHFDHPHLYGAEVTLGTHTFSTTFGIRRIEVRDGRFHLNGEPVTLMGVERMAGSNPQYGMAEPESWIVHDHDDMKELNAVFTRVHWPQDRRVLDYCDRHGILMQTEVPAWGGATFRGMADRPLPEIMRNGLEQLREMIASDAHHPSIFAWGLCNEIDGQNPVAAEFARKLRNEAKRLDPGRLCTYASNSLQQTPGRDVAGEMDFIEWNEYYGSWYKGSTEDLRRQLDEIHKAFPGKTIVISEYGYCACTPERPEDDAARERILRDQTRVLRDHPAVGGMIFFCYNDYRTHIGDRGAGAMQQRVHGVVNLLGGRKPSFAALREESSPIESLAVYGRQVIIRTRPRGPGYTLAGYRLRAIGYDGSGIPIERQEVALPVLQPGGEKRVELAFTGTAAVRAQLDVVRPTGFSVLTHNWRLEP
ncbi:MAG TPA: glycoside hydrolase family 2 TIM barrel-domain containing protein [Bryobacteraceae bacterium]|nr:glycoside hydrolase family 2 TIM barrel-domain containing protein [Bryobacteraceae bacterium]